MGCTWVKEYDGFEAGVFIVIDLQLLEGQHQLVKDAHGHPVHLCQLWAVPRDDVVIAWVGREGEWMGKPLWGYRSPLALDRPYLSQCNAAGALGGGPHGG